MKTQSLRAWLPQPGPESFVRLGCLAGRARPRISVARREGRHVKGKARWENLNVVTTLQARFSVDAADYRANQKLSASEKQVVRGSGPSSKS